MNATTTSVTVFWNLQENGTEGWAYRAEHDNAENAVEFGLIDGVESDDIDNAIGEACRILGLPLTPDQFARDQQTDGGYAVWTTQEV